MVSNSASFSPRRSQRIREQQGRKPAKSCLSVAEDVVSSSAEELPVPVELFTSKNEMPSSNSCRRTNNKKLRRIEVISSTSDLAPEDAEEAVISSAEDLPAEMLCQILQNIDKKSLTNSRLVCRTWRNTIDDGMLIKTLTFTIVDVKTFLGSQLANKVKSIRFIKPLKGTHKSLEEFFTKIGSTVEEIFLNFDVHKGNRKKVAQIKKGEKLIFAMILRFCTRLNSLTIKSEGNNYDFIKGCTDDPRNATVLNIIQSLSVIVLEKDLDDLSKLLLTLPNLRNLDLNCDEFLEDDVLFLRLDDNDTRKSSAENRFLGLVLDHLRKYNGKLQEISLENASGIGEEVLIKLLLTVGQLFPNTNIKCSLALEALLKFKETGNVQVNETSCRLIKDGLLDFFDADDDEDDDEGDLVNDTRRIGYCSNLHYLDVENYGKHTNLEIKLEFIKQLRKLNYLKIKDGSFHMEFEEEDRILLSGDFFSFGVPSLTTLDLDGQILEMISISFHLCFPSLTKLSLRRYGRSVNDNIIYSLTNLVRLKCLKLQQITKLTNQHFTQIHDFVEGGEIIKLPAIAGFKNLKHLHIVECDNLTDNFLTNGLALCGKLEKITLCYTKGKEKFTTCGLNSFQEVRNFTVRNLPSSHGKKHGGEVMNSYQGPECEYKRFTI